MLYCLCDRDNKVNTFQKKINALLKSKGIKSLSEKEILSLPEESVISGMTLRIKFSEDRKLIRKATLEMNEVSSAWTEYPEIVSEEISCGFRRLYDINKCPPEIQRILETVKISGNEIIVEKNPFISADSLAFDIKLLKFRLENVI